MAEIYDRRPTATAVADPGAAVNYLAVVLPSYGCTGYTAQYARMRQSQLHQPHNGSYIQDRL